MARAPDTGSTGDGHRPGPARWGVRILAGVFAVVVLALVAAWFARERIAGDAIDSQLGALDIPARYEIVSLSPRSAVLADIVVGDPARPDLTARRAVIGIGYGLGLPRIDRVRLDGARLHASLKRGEPSLGTLDPLLEPGEGEAGLPAIDLQLVDARALVETDYGRVGIKAQGSGRLDGGFSGEIAATAPGLGVPGADVTGCRAARATLYAAVTTQAGAASLAGPLRLGGADCAGVRVSKADATLRVDIPESLDALDARFDLAAEGIAAGSIAAQRLVGSGRAGWSDGVFNLRHDLAFERVDAGPARFDSIGADGALRSVDGFARSEWDGALSGEGIALAALDNGVPAGIEDSLEGTLLAPLAAKFARNFRTASRGGVVRADLTARVEDGALSLVVPEARLTSGAGETILGASRVSWSQGALRGNLMTGGAGLPRISGRMEQAGGPGDVGGEGGGEGAGDLVFRLAMAPYEALSQSGEAVLAVPRMELRRTRAGFAFAGVVEASGAIPGGRIEGLRLPLAGTYAGGRLAVGRRCTALAFERVLYAALEIGRERVTLCPDEARAMVLYDDALRLSLAAEDLAVEGGLGETRLRLAAERARLSTPGGFALSGLEVALGEDEAAVRLAAAALTGEIGETITGAFAGGTAAIDAVPLDLAALSGDWRYDGGVLHVERGGFVLSERTDAQARFEPLVARDAALALDTGTIRAEAVLRNPGSDARVAQVSVRHDLETARGTARIEVPGVVFGDALAPEDLTYLAKGIIADVAGTVSGEGRIAWDGEEVTSTGRFRSDSLDLAAAFGPVTGLAGEIVFTDLLGLTTAPGQVVTIESINPGVEVLAGRVAFALDGGQVVRVEDARWPFMGGTLIMRPVVLDYSSAEEKAYVFEIVGLEADRFVAEMELTNLSATGTFDGAVPIVFDGDGNGRIENGLLISRPPGGNVSYIGELTYEDMGAMTNFAFQALRSLDYTQMAVSLEGNLAGEIITRFTFDGVRQGEGANRNFITRRLSRLPIRFKINVRSQNFHQLATMVRSFWDADYLGNPVDRGLLRSEDGRLAPRTPAPGEASDPSLDATRPEDRPVQPPESEDTL